MVHVFCTSSNSALHLCEVSWKYLQRFSTYRADMSTVHGRNGYVKCSKGNDSKSRQTRVMVHVFCTSSHSALHLCEVWWKYLWWYQLWSGHEWWRRWQTDGHSKFRTVYFFYFFYESEEDDLEEEEEDDLCFLLFLDLCFLLGWSLLLCLLWDVWLSFDLQVLLGSSITILGSDIWLKSGSRGNNTLLEVAGLWGSFENECSEPKSVWLATLYSLPTAWKLLIHAW